MWISLIIPCYNEYEGLRPLVKRCAELAAQLDGEIVLVDNGSTDDTPNLLPSLLSEHENIHSVRVPENQGYGYGILFGLKAARGKFLAWTHADLQTDPMDVLRGIEILKASSTPEKLYVKGLRKKRPLADAIFTFGMTVFETAAMSVPLRDINAQPNIFHRSFFKSWEDDAPHDFSLDLFAYYMSKRNNMDVIRFPVLFERREFGQSKWNVDWNSKKKFIMRTIDFTIDLKKSLRKRV